jgi:hypothetical protein
MGEWGERVMGWWLVIIEASTDIFGTDEEKIQDGAADGEQESGDEG